MAAMAMWQVHGTRKKSAHAGCLEWQNGFDAAAKHQVYVGIIPKV